ncbi:PAS domain-containing sensor histidine kinase [Halorubrum vacuolatum]|uniref:histidine kinase n=1 Tax=Halorubrum vacuolatum TaxID=63740 RepID=A0A238Y409_HALVU|nr:PAS domain-containing sensor histidine kinase [Halorubrum vacuolatum]SNR65568.1 PAS domain S-box-containing protein [Halorubrum vacuolatum]
MCSDEPTDTSHSPATRYGHLIDHIQDAVIELEFVDGVPIIADVNDSFEIIFGYEPEAVIGDPLNPLVVPEWKQNEARDFDQAVLSGEVTYKHVKRKTASGLRHFLYRGIPYHTPDRRGGFAIYTDLTEVHWNEQRFHVMTRILRHNLRTQTNIIDGYLSELFAELEETGHANPELQATLTDAVTSLERLIEETHAIRTVINDSPDTDTITDCVPIIENAVHTLAQTYPDATIDTALPDTLPVHANANLQYAVESLIDNAITHNPAQAPYVRVRAAETTTHRWVSISVDDNGPLIPDAETDIITGQTSISPTRHSSGLGLWLVKWTTELFGGELRFETSEFDGNTVQLRLPTTPS